MSGPLLAAILLAGCGLVIDEEEHAARLDGDGDGYVAAEHGGDDCDDGDAAVHPAADELCNGLDDDCSGTADDDPVDAETWIRDDDGDGFGRPEDSVVACTQPEGYSSGAEQRPDCNDGDATIHPDADEVCDGEDNDCDGEEDEGLTGTFYEDGDGDGWGDADTAATGCPDEGTWVETSGDCDDSDGGINPDAAEVCGNEVDEDCDDEAQACPVLELEDADFEGPGQELGDGYGYRVASLDGKVAVSSPWAEDGAGAAWFHAEPATSGLDAARASLVVRGATGTVSVEDPAWGSALALSDDLLDRGTLTLVVGGPGYDLGGGVALVEAVPGAERSLDDADVLVFGDAFNGSLGAAVAAVGDVTGDEVPDLLVGDPSHVDPLDDSDFTGSAWVLAGPLSGLVEVGEGAWLSGYEYGSETGRVVAAAGDVDGDGVGEVLVGAPQSGTLSGLVHLVYGPIKGDLELEESNVIIATPESYELLGDPLASGDVDGDGLSDLVVGAAGVNRTDYGSGELGYTYVFTEVDAAPPDSIEDASARLEQLERGDSADDDVDGKGLDASADFDGDDRQDILIGFPGRTDPADAIGTVYLVYGGVSGSVGLELAPVSFVDGGAGTWAGRSVAATQLDGDGTPDLLVGAPGPTDAPGRVFGQLGGAW